MTILYTILWFLVWLIGAIIVYFCGVRMNYYPHSWNNDKRRQMVSISCFSWVVVGIFIIIGAAGLTVISIAWLVDRYLVPILKKLEPKMDKK